MTLRKFLSYCLVFLLASAGVSFVAVLVSLIMFSGITGPIGYFAWLIVCSPALVIGKGGDLTVSSVVSGISWGLIATLVCGALGRRRP
jgi:hypothetical protein